MNTVSHNAFTSTYPQIVSQLITSATISGNNQRMDISTALWDTGATGTCISERVAATLGLVPTGFQEIHTPSGKKTVQTFLVDILLPNQVRISGIKVCNTDIGDQGIDILIGMDIIQMGDFAITYHNNQTVFSFCIPPYKTIDYVNQLKLQKLIGQPHGKGKRKKK